MVFFLEIIKNGIEDRAVGDCVVIIKVAVCSGLFINVETLYGVEVGAFFLGV
jgi:hypothetical protein